MASRKKKNNRKPSRGRRIALICFAALLALLLAVCGVAAINATTLHVRRARVTVPDLPPSFEGRTLLFASDIDLCGLNTPGKSAALFHRLQALEPDMLVLGGDYTSSTLLDQLNRPPQAGFDDSQRRARTDFFLLIKDFRAPLGKFAVAAPEDADLPDLQAAMGEAGIRLLRNEGAEIALGGDRLYIAGIDGVDPQAPGRRFSRGDCVIAAAWSPSAFPKLVTGEAADGGPWADLVLSGHTHGGQIRLFGRSVLALDALEQQYLSGWRVENGVPVLVSSGVGCEGANLRLGSRAEVWLVTLTAQSSDE